MIQKAGVGSRTGHRAELKFALNPPKSVETDCNLLAAHFSGLWLSARSLDQGVCDKSAKIHHPS